MSFLQRMQPFLKFFPFLTAWHNLRLPLPAFTIMAFWLEVQAKASIHLNQKIIHVWLTKLMLPLCTTE